MFRLRSKILLAFTIIILSGTVLMVGFINFTTRSGYENFARQNDLDFSLNLSMVLKEYYRVNRSWDGVENLLLFTQQRTSQGQMKGMMNTPRMRGFTPRIIVADRNGRIIVNTDSEYQIPRGSIDRENLPSGSPVIFDNLVVGYVFTGSMIQRGLSENEKQYLNRTTIIIVSVSLFILLVSVVFSWFFAGKLAKPVSALNDAASSIQIGDFSKRVSVEGADELAVLSKSFNNMAESLENNDKWRKQIIADSAHELRTPVSLIQGNLEMILDGVYKADREHLKNIYDETLVLSRLIKELQELSSAESGSLSLNREDLDINLLIENVLGIFRAGEVKEKISLKNSISEALPLVHGDYQKLKQVFANVLANAFRHTPEGGTVELFGEIGSSSIIIEIRDTGPGIDKEDLEKIFERFYRTDSSRNRNHGGSGLGLAISREIIKLHNGQIYARSERGKGASIFISLPFINEKKSYNGKIE